MLRSYASIAYNQASCQLSAILAEQALIEGAVPFHLVFDQHLENLKPYRVLVLPDSECLSDAQIALIRTYVENGGVLMVVGASGMYDEWRRARPSPGLAGLVDAKPAVHAYESMRSGMLRTARRCGSKWGAAGFYTSRQCGSMVRCRSLVLTSKWTIAIGRIPPMRDSSSKDWSG